jgi:hypothetical protein
MGVVGVSSILRDFNDAPNEFKNSPVISVYLHAVNVISVILGRDLIFFCRRSLLRTCTVS